MDLQGLLSPKNKKRGKSTDRESSRRDEVSPRNREGHSIKKKRSLFSGQKRDKDNGYLNNKL